MDIKTLDNEIKKGALKRVYFFYGPESFLIENKIKSIKRRIVSEEFEAVGCSKFEGKDADIRTFIEECDFLPFVTEKKVVIVKNTGWFNNANTNDYKMLKEYIENVPEYLHIIFVENGFDKKREKNIEFIEKIGGIVFFDIMTVNQLSVWVDKMFSDAGKSVSPADISFIINACSQSMARIFSEVNKLILFSGDNSKIKREDIDALVVKTSEYKIYEMFDDIVNQNRHKATEKLLNLLESGEKPTVVISSVSGKLYELLLVKLLNSDRASVKEISSYLDFPRPDFVIKKMIAQSKKFGEPYLKRMIKKGIEYDRKIKNGRISGEKAAEMYVMELIKMD